MNIGRFSVALAATGMVAAGVLFSAITLAQPARMPDTPTTLGLYQEPLRPNEVIRFSEGPVVIKTITVHSGVVNVEDGPEGLRDRAFRFGAGTADGRRREIPHTYPLDVRFEGAVIIRCVEGPARVTMTFETR